MRFRMMIVASAIVALAGCTGRSTGENTRTDLSSAWTTPAGWKAESLSLPPDFAPNMAFHGREELRTPQGFLDPSSDRFLSYAFVWRPEGNPDLSKPSLERALTDYFRGLARDVSAGRHPIDANAIGATLTEMTSVKVQDARAEGSRLRGEIRVLDPSRTGGTLTLHADVRAGWCEGSAQPRILVIASPHSREHAVWTELDALGDSFECPSSQRVAAR